MNRIFFQLSPRQRVSPAQILTFKFVICVNAFPQSPHTYGRTWEWILSWFRRLAACVNAMKIKNERKIGYQSIFNFRFSFDGNKQIIDLLFWQIWHWYFRSAVWFRMCVNNDDFLANVFEHKVHVPSSPYINCSCCLNKNYNLKFIRDKLFNNKKKKKIALKRHKKYNK